MAAVVAVVASCTKVDDTLGQGYIPKNESMQVVFHDLKGTDLPFEARLGVNDSVPASGQGVIFIGQTTDAVFGKTRAAAMTDFYPASTKFNSERLFGNKPVADSMFMEVMINDIVGDASKAQKFNIYRMTDSLRRDSTYKMHTPGKNTNYPSWPQKTLVEMTDMSAPLFTFELNDKIPFGSLALVRLSVTDKGKAFMQDLAATPADVSAAPWPGFHKLFNGLYIAPQDDNTAVFEMQLRNSYSGFYMWFHNYDEGWDAGKTDSDKHIADTAYVTYDFSDGTDWYSDARKVNICLSDMTSEYPFDVASDNVVTTGYIETLGGVGTRLKASEKLLSWVAGLDKKAVFNKAELIIPMAGAANSVERLDRAPKRLGMYYWYGAGWNIPDYYYTYELNNTSSFIPYGGYLSRSLMQYKMDITQWLTKLLEDPATVAPQEIWLSSEIVTRANDFRRVALDMSKMELKVTYTMTE